jgi:hypothetical protein
VIKDEVWIQYNGSHLCQHILFFFFTIFYFIREYMSTFLVLAASYILIAGHIITDTQGPFSK